MKKAFSLIELLIYTGLFAVAAGLLTGITLTVTRVQTQESAGLEVTRQSQFIMQRIQNLVRESSLVEDGCEGKISSFSPLPSCPSSQCTGDFCFLKLRTEVSGTDPTYIYIPSETDGVYLKQGNSDAVALTTDKVKVGMLKFSTIANPGGHSIVNVDLTLNYNSANPILSGASKRLTSAVSRVSAATFDSNLLPNADNTLSIGAAGTPGTVPTWRNILMVNGTVASPSYSFGASSTTGIFSPGTGIIGFSTGGSERMRIDASGNVGIGTTGPGYKLDVSGDIRTTGNLIEKVVAFTPTTVGWYRVVSAGGMAGGTVRIAGAYDNRQTDVEIQYFTMGYSQGGSIQETRYASYNSGVVSQTRISSNGAGSVYLDIYISSATTPGPVTLYGYGPSMPAFVTSPVVGAVAGSADVNTLTLGHGFRTTQGANFAETGGNVGIGTTNPGQKLTVAGTIESTSGGFKFPDGTTQTTAAASFTNWSSAINEPNLKQLISANSSVDVVNISGNGVFLGCHAFTYFNNPSTIYIDVTIDGSLKSIPFRWANNAGLTLYAHARATFFGPFKYSTSLRVQIRNASTSSSYDVTASCQYQ
jgi:hypothetical protein